MQQIDEEQQQRLKAYTKASIIFFVLIIFSFLLLIGLPIMIPNVGTALYGPSELLDVWVHGLLHLFSWQPINSWYPLQVLVYYAFLIVIWVCVCTPMALYVGYSLRKRYKIGDVPSSRRMYILSIWMAQWRWIVKWAYLFEVMYLLFVVQPNTWWLWMALVECVILLIQKYRWTSVLKRFFTMTPLPEGELSQRLKNLQKRLSTNVSAVCITPRTVKNVRANAFLVGWGRTRQIALTSELLNEFPVDEVEVIMAHELAHYIHHDALKQTIIQTISHIIGYFCVNIMLVYCMVVFYHSADKPADASYLPLLIFFLSFSWLNYIIVFHYFSRKHEYQADEFALRATGDVTAFKNAMVRLANSNLILARTLGGRESSTHPSIESRLKHADEFALRRAKRHSVSSPTGG